MARLSKQEEEMLERLNAKREAPDGPSIGSVNVTLDLGDPKAVALAKKLGISFGDEDDEGGDGDDDKDGDGEGDAKPKRRGYFNE